MARTRSAILAAVAGAALAVLGVVACAQNPASAALMGTRIDATAPPPAATLTDQNGHPFTFAAHRGKELVLFFGYAHCRDVCPATMAKIAHAYRTIGGTPGRVEVAFVTVDRAHDTPAALKRYVRVFDPHFYGLTGSPEALRTVYDAYHVWFQPLPARGSAAAEIAHPSQVYILGGDGRLRDIVEWTEPASTFAHDMQALLP
jgi:protein SCO1/2